MTYDVILTTCKIKTWARIGAKNAKNGNNLIVGSEVLYSINLFKATYIHSECSWRNW